MGPVCTLIVGPNSALFDKASGLRWLSLMLLAPVPWAQRVWALPFLTALAPSERYCQQRGRRHKKRKRCGGDIWRYVTGL